MILAVMVAGMLVFSLGSAALAADETGGHNARPVTMVRRSGPVLAGGLTGGVVGSRHDGTVLAGGLNGGVVGSRHDEALMGGRVGGVIGSNEDGVMLSGGLTGGVVGSKNDVMLSGGRGGISGDTRFDVIAGGRPLYPLD
jgi:hypothetical protein